jgi:hypothetical protein
MFMPANNIKTPEEAKNCRLQYEDKNTNRFSTDICEGRGILRSQFESLNLLFSVFFTFQLNLILKMTTNRNFLIALTVLLVVNSSRSTEITEIFENIEFWISLFVAFAIWCYRCNSATPGCSDNFNWRGIGYLGEPCPEDDDICVKVIERKGGKLVDDSCDPALTKLVFSF